MPEKKVRRFVIDADVFEVHFQYDPLLARWYGNYTVFAETPRYTPNGRPWKNVFDADCEYTDSAFGDCGGCSYFHREKPKDVIAVCFREEMRKDPDPEV